MDREKVIGNLTSLRERLKWQKDIQGYGVYISFVDDAIDLLKEPYAVEPFHRCIGKDFSIILIEDSHFDYCPYCGKPITWAKQEGR